jgi:CheY-like chemotaxis protein
VLVVTIVEDQRLVFGLGAADYLGKPYQREALIKKIHRLLPELDGKRVLVVDDDAEARIILSRILTDEHVEVALATSGDQAMAMIAENRPDLVLLDLMMPGMSGFEVAARLRTHPETASIPVMIVSAKELTAEDLMTLGDNVQRFVAKGTVDPQGLVNAVRQLLGQGKRQGVAA